jgi:hypothetical protein
MLHCVLDNFLAKSIDYFRIEKNAIRNTSSSSSSLLSSITSSSAPLSPEFEQHSLVHLAKKSNTTTIATTTECNSNTSDFDFDELNNLIDHNNNCINQTSKTISIRPQQGLKANSNLLTSISLFNELDWFHTQENKEFLQLEENQFDASEQARDICDYENYESYLDSFFSINNRLNTSNKKNNQCEEKSSQQNFKLYLTREKEMSSQEAIADLTDDFLFAHELNSIPKNKSIKPVLVYEKDYYRDNKLNDDDSDIVPSWRIKDRVSVFFN